MRATSSMLNEIMVLLYMITEWLDWMKLRMVFFGRVWEDGGKVRKRLVVVEV